MWPDRADARRGCAPLRSLPLNLRETLLLLGVVVVFAAATLFVVFTGGEHPAPVAPDDASVPEAPVPAESPATPLETAPDAAPPTPSAEPVQRIDSPGGPAAENPGYGVIDGRVVLASDAAGKVDQFTITVEEMVNPNSESGHEAIRLTRGFKAESSQSPLYFGFDHVPFSRFGYRATVFVAGLNGSSQVIRVTEQEWNPSVTLSLTGGAPFSLRLTDQSRDPYGGKAVSMTPVGYPPGRPLLRGETDNFGTAVFASVLAGEYEVRLIDHVAGNVTVDPPGYVKDQAGVGAQSALLVVPRGRTVRVEVFDDGGYGLAGAEVVLFAIDTVENRRFTAESDASGVVEFEFVLPGRYQLDVRGTGRQPTSRTLQVGDDADPEPQRIRLPLL